MLVSEVFDVLDRLTAAGVRWWLAGGWGVDALVGRTTREHRDVDLAVDADDADVCLRVLADLGYRPETDWLPVRIELRAPGDRWVDVHPVVFDENGHGRQAGFDGDHFDYPPAALATGTLDGRPVSCLSVRQQLAFHAGYEPRPQDLHDLALLATLGAELQRLQADHAPAVLAFELANRAYFTASISDRGDEYFDQFTDRHRALLAEQEGGTCAFYVLVAADGSVLGRFNLYDLEDGTARLGYRVAEQVAGRGAATATVRELCELAVTRHGLHTLQAATAGDNVASQKVLTKAGFVPVGPAGPADLGGKSGTWYQRDLS